MISQNSIRAASVTAFAAAALFLSVVALKGQARIDGPPPPEADLAVTKVGTPDPVNADADVTYTIEVTNGGPDVAMNVVLDDTLPGTMTFVSLSSPAGWTCSTPAPGAGGLIHCTRPGLVPADNNVFTLVGHVPAGTLPGTNYTNVALVTTATFDPNKENNSASASNTVPERDPDAGRLPLERAEDQLPAFQQVKAGPVQTRN